MSLEITGKLLIKYPVVEVRDKFKKREFVLELTEEINGNSYTNFAKMQLVQAKCDAINNYNEGDMLKVSFNIKGTRYEKDGKVNYFSNLDAWRIEAASAGQHAATTTNNNNNYSQPAPAYNNAGASNNYSAPNTAAPAAVDDLPF